MTEARSIFEQLAKLMGENPFPPPKLNCSPDDLIAELRRERAMRVKVYPGLIRKGTLTDAQRAKRMACLDDAIAVVEAVFAGELATEKLL